MTYYIANAFSLNMVDSLDWKNIRIKPISLNDVKNITLDFAWDSIVGHEDTARVISGLVGFEVPFRRETFTLTKGNRLLVAQYSGPRMVEGSKELPPGAKIAWALVSLSN